ncbi:hypothetical protein ACJMK2_032330 [Sinanodonta woodiana]|uniref:Uncharacterized protein n=1 Tax=Sinanodonta woodiana TaxID=1069815 RepID=A0ABD3X1E0_SINWO
MSRMSTTVKCGNANFSMNGCIIYGLGSALLLLCLILIVVTFILCCRLKSLKQSREGSYKRSKTCKHYRLSMRELQEQEDAWDEENGFTNFEPMITIGSAFDSPHHGPTPPPPPPPPKEAIHTDSKTVGTDGYPKDSGQTSNLAEPCVKKKVPLIPPHSKTLPNVLGRRFPDDFDEEYDNIAAVGPLFHTLDYRLDQPKRRDHPGLLDAGYNRPDGWHYHPDDQNPYYVGKISDLQSLRSYEDDINGNNILNVNDILMNANAIEVIHETTLPENMNEQTASANDDDNVPTYLKSIFRQSLSSYTDMASSLTGDDYVQMKITLSRLAASEICRKARLRGIKCNSEVLFGHVMDKPTNSSFICGLAGEDFGHTNTCSSMYIEVTD